MIHSIPLKVCSKVRQVCRSVKYSLKVSREVWQSAVSPFPVEEFIDWMVRFPYEYVE